MDLNGRRGRNAAYCRLPLYAGGLRQRHHVHHEFSLFSCLMECTAAGEEGPIEWSESKGRTCPFEPQVSLKFRDGNFTLASPTRAFESVDGSYRQMPASSGCRKML